MKIEDRYFNLLDMFLMEGAVYLLHYSVFHFGYSGKPMHFAVSTSNLKLGTTKAFFNPCTSNVSNKNNKDIFAFNLAEEIKLNDQKFKQTYVLLSLSRYVRLVDFTHTEFCVYKGKMKEDTLNKYRKAKQEFILWNHNKRKKS
jgi:hypothetical protein